MPQQLLDQGPDSIEEAVSIVVSLLSRFHAWSLQEWEAHVGKHPTFDTPQCFREENRTIDRFLARAVSSQTEDPALAVAAARRVKSRLLESIQKRRSSKLRVIGDRWDPPQSTKLTLYLELLEAIRHPKKSHNPVQPLDRASRGSVRSEWLSSPIPEDRSKIVHPRIPGSQCALWRRFRAKGEEEKTLKKKEFSSCGRECEVLFFFEEQFSIKELAQHLDIPVPTLHRYKDDCKGLELKAKATQKAGSQGA